MHVNENRSHFAAGSKSAHTALKRGKRLENPISCENAPLSIGPFHRIGPDKLVPQSQGVAPRLPGRGGPEPVEEIGIIPAAIAEREAGFRSLKDTWADTTTPHRRADAHGSRRPGGV
jgi:hypothetical protein